MRRLSFHGIAREHSRGSKGMPLGHAELWLRGGGGARAPAEKSAAVAGEAQKLTVRARHLPPGATCAVWAADPHAAPTLNASYHTAGPLERMPDARTFDNLAVTTASPEGKVSVQIANPMHGYTSVQESYSEPPHIHLRYWQAPGLASRTYTYNLPLPLLPRSA